MYACRSIAVAALVLATLSLSACGEKSKHAADGDTGAAAPATQRDMSATPATPDPTTTSATTTSQPMTTGDTVTRSTKAGGNQSTPAARRQP
jgi:ABC-type oligopeptide transport system substrate-binding subunit